MALVFLILLLSITYYETVGQYSHHSLTDGHLSCFQHFTITNLVYISLRTVYRNFSGCDVGVSIVHMEASAFERFLLLTFLETRKHAMTLWVMRRSTRFGQEAEEMRGKHGPKPSLCFL